MRHMLRAAFAALVVTVLGTAAAQSPNPQTVRVRGVIQAVTPNGITVDTRGRHEHIELAFSDKLVITEVFAMKLADIQPGTYIGAAALPTRDGSAQRAIAITVFPESMRGTGEGHRPFDFLPESTMTNATVADVAAAPTGRTMKLRYKDGEKTLIVPPEAPVVSFKPGDRSLLVPGASVSVLAQLVNDKPMAVRISAGRNGFAVPY